MDETKRNFRVVVEESYERLSHRAANLICEQLHQRPDMLLAAASGSTPTLTYELLAKKVREDPKSFERLRVLKLDEWGGLAATDPGSCEAYLQQYIVGPWNIPEDRYLTFRGDAGDPEAESRRLRDHLEKQGPIDLCILGLGLNGHLGLNEPGDQLEPFTHVAELSEVSLRHSMLQRTDYLPLYGLTIGMTDILRSKKILLLVSGSKKRDAVRRLFKEEISTHFPASLLWTAREVICLCDSAAVTGFKLPEGSGTEVIEQNGTKEQILG